MSRLVKLLVVSLSLLVVSYVGLGYVLGKTTDDRDYRALIVFSEVLQRIQQEYVEEPNLPLVTSGALHGLLESLDPHSSYLAPREYAEYRRKSKLGLRGQVGLALSKRFGYIAVVSVLPDSPAHQVGLRPGDILEAIAGFTTREMSIEQAQTLLEGEPGSVVKVSVVSRRFSSSGQAQEIEITRRELSTPRLLADKIEGEIAYLRVPALNPGRAEEIRQKLAQFDRQGLRKLILDLRDCAFGQPAEAIETARLFVPSGTLVTLRGQTVPAQPFPAQPDKVVWRHPVVVLISGGTSGPAELLAAALAGNAAASGQRVPLVGERTFGTASEQKVMELGDQGALVLTVANYYAPDGKSIADDGVAPSVEVRASLDVPDAADSDSREPAPDFRLPSRDDPVLKKALELLLTPARVEGKGQARLAPARLTRAPAA